MKEFYTVPEYYCFHVEFDGGLDFLCGLLNPVVLESFQPASESRKCFNLC